MSLKQIFCSSSLARCSDMCVFELFSLDEVCCCLRSRVSFSRIWENLGKNFNFGKIWGGGGIVNLIKFGGKLKFRRNLRKTYWNLGKIFPNLRKLRGKNWNLAKILGRNLNFEKIWKESSKFYEIFEKNLNLDQILENFKEKIEILTKFEGQHWNFDKIWGKIWIYDKTLRKNWQNCSRTCFSTPTSSSSTLCWMPLEVSMNLQSRDAANCLPSAI